MPTPDEILIDRINALKSSLPDIYKGNPRDNSIDHVVGQLAETRMASESSGGGGGSISGAATEATMATLLTQGSPVAGETIASGSGFLGWASWIAKNVVAILNRLPNPVDERFPVDSNLASMGSAFLDLPASTISNSGSGSVTVAPTGTFAPTWGVSQLFAISVSAASGTTPKLDVRVEESLDGLTGWTNVYTFPTLTANGTYKSSYIAISGRSYRYVETISGTNPSFTRSISRYQSNVAVSPSPQKMQLASPAQATYAAAVTIAAVTAATDLFGITGSASKIVRVTRFSANFLAGAVSRLPIALIKRSSNNAGGTIVNANIVPLDSTNPAATATVNGYTANPTTLGTNLGDVRKTRVLVPVGTTAVDEFQEEFCFGNSIAQPVVLRGTTESLWLNLGAANGAGTSVVCYVEWTEE